MIEAVFAFASAVAIALCVAMRPGVVRCPDGWYAEGVRPSGWTTCRPAPVGPQEWSPTRGVIDHSVQAPGRVDLLVHCTGGARPIVQLDGRTVGCSR